MNFVIFQKTSKWLAECLFANGIFDFGSAKPASTNAEYIYRQFYEILLLKTLLAQNIQSGNIKYFPLKFRRYSHHAIQCIMCGKSIVNNFSHCELITMAILTD